MRFLTRLFGGKAADTSRTSVVAPHAKVDVPVMSPSSQAAKIEVPQADVATLKSVTDHVASVEPVAETAVNIWDMEDDDSAAVEAVVEAPVKNRRRRNATRLIGFDSGEEAVVDLFDQKAADTDQATMQFPTGWLVVVEGEGRGHCFGLTSGLNQVGRGAENSIQLDFGDTSISRKNHFAVAYDEEERKFILGHGGKSNVIRLNGKAVISNEDLADGDKIKVGKTIVQIKTLCGPDFDWAQDDNAEGQDDVAIA